MDLLTWTIIIVGTNVGTYLLTRLEFYSMMKQTKLLPAFLAIASGNASKMQLNLDVAEEYMPRFRKNMRQCGMPLDE